jgi:hypothetical protein
VSAIDHRRLGVDLYNTTWTLLDRSDRTREDDDAMLAAAYASMYHWSRYEGAGPQNTGRAHWLTARVHAVLGHPDAAAHHARRYVEIAEAGGVEDWDLAAALEASARAAVVAGDFDAAERFEARAREACAAISDPDDRAVVEADLATLPRRP